MQRQALIFEGPRRIKIEEEGLPAGQPGQVLIKTEISAISAGTELLFYRGQIPENMAMDASLPELAAEAEYPLRYGYQLVGRIIDSQVEGTDELLGALVFAFQPHQSHFWTDAKNLIFIPENLPAEDAVFLPNMETAVNFMHDGRPLLGEKVVVLGQGIVGLLTTSLLAAHPIHRLITVDGIESRRRISQELGADASLKPDDMDGLNAALKADASQAQVDSADLIYELSGNPQALNTAIALCGYKSRLILGSWYGTKSSELEFGGKFHRNRVQIISSQVSTIDPVLRGRWTKTRRMASAIEQLHRIQPSRLISHRFDISEADKAYELLEAGRQDLLQIIFTYQD